LFLSFILILRFDQIVLYSLAAVFSGAWLGLWVRLDRWRKGDGRDIWNDTIWKKFGRFSALICIGCASGAIGYGARLGYQILLYRLGRPEGKLERYQILELRASSHRHLVVINTFYPIEFLCFIVATNMMLRRVVRHASHAYYNRARDQDGRSYGEKFDFRDCIGEYAIAKMQHSIAAVTALLCVAGIFARLVAVGFRAQVAATYDRAAGECYQKLFQNCSTHESVSSEVSPLINRSGTAVSSQIILEVAALSIMTAAYLLFFPITIVMFARVRRRLANILQQMDLRTDHGTVLLPFEFCKSESQTEMPTREAREFLQALDLVFARKQRWFVFSFFLALASLFMRMVLAVIVCYANVDPNVIRNPGCENCGPCQSTQYLVQQWLNFNGNDVFPIWTSLCSVPTQMVMLWVMLTAEDRAWLLFVKDPTRGMSARALAVDEHAKRMGLELRNTFG
jgi:hypothetical protein